MTKEDKELQLKDLCARLSYRLIVNWSPTESVSKEIVLDVSSNLETWLLDAARKEQIKPYLRPMSSMTKDEIEESDNIWYYNKRYELIDWYNEHHFDYRGLIEKGLALEAPNGMYN